MPDAPGGETPSLGFFIDEDLPPAIGRILSDRGIRSTSVVAEGRAGMTDEEQLHFAAAHGLVLVTTNVADYVELARQWAAGGQEHAGMVFVLTTRFPRRDPRAIARAILGLAARETSDQLRNSARFLTPEG